MSELHSMIQVSRSYGALGIEQIHAHWVGDPPIAYVDFTLVRYLFGRFEDGLVGRRFSIGELRLRVVGIDWGAFRLVVMRDGWRARLRAASEPVRRRAERAYRRLIVTAAVWGLADHEPHVIPTWRDLRLPRRKP
ncbi:MAG TPA: hypothetical protein VFL91_08265 [Thermomicrobiales bacterium]|nr:hypothetical protein [Thermomicrobiales bacterium]